MVYEKMRQPGGETQTFDPRPRPATWVVAVTVKPGGKVERSLGFLSSVSHGKEIIPTKPTSQAEYLYSSQLRHRRDIFHNLPPRHPSPPGTFSNSRKRHDG